MKSEGSTRKLKRMHSSIRFVSMRGRQSVIYEIVFTLITYLLDLANLYDFIFVPEQQTDQSTVQ